MPDIYGLENDPLDVSSLIQQVVPQAPAAPAQAPSQQKPGWKQMAMLAAMIPIAAKRGGRAGIAGLLQGIQQAQARKQQTQQQQFQNSRLTAQDQAAEQYRRQMLSGTQAAQQATNADRDRAARMTFLEKFQGALGGVEDPDQIAGLLDAYGLAGNELGVQRGALDRMAMQTVTPSSLEKKAATKHLAALKSQHGEKWLETGQQFVYTMPYGKKATLQELLAMQGQDTGGAPIKSPEPIEKPETRGIAVQAADALRRGDTAEYQRLVKVQRDIGQADDRPSTGATSREWVIRDGAPVRVRDADIRPGDLPYDPVKVRQTPTGAPSPYAAERRQRNRQSVNELMGKVGPSTVGFGTGTMSSIGGTPARNFKAELDTLKANIGFSELTEMREASKTGGALGQVSDREIALLTSTLGALDQGQSPANFKAQLQKILDSLDRWDRARASAIPGQNAPPPLGKTSEVGQVYLYNGKKVRVREKTRTGFLFDEVP